MILTIDDEIVEVLRDMDALVDSLADEGHIEESAKMDKRLTTMAAAQLLKQISKGEAV